MGTVCTTRLPDSHEDDQVSDNSNIPSHNNIDKPTNNPHHRSCALIYPKTSIKPSVDNDDDLQMAMAMSLSLQALNADNAKSNAVVSNDPPHDQKSWICSLCNAMNRLIDTVTVYDLKCAVCHYQTYIPGSTPLLMSYEWDHPLYHTSNTTKHNNKHNNKHKMYHKRRCRSVDCKMGTLLMYGFLRKSCLQMSFEHGLIKLFLFYIDIFRVPWDLDHLYSHNKEGLILDKHLLCLRRTYIDKDCFKNAFGSAIVSAPGHDWILKIEKIRNKSSQNSVVIGIIDAEGTNKFMGAPFHFYNDSHWKYFDEGIVYIALKWNNECTKCELLFHGKVCYEVDPNKEYRLAVALKVDAHVIKSIRD